MTPSSITCVFIKIALATPASSWTTAASSRVTGQVYRAGKGEG